MVRQISVYVDDWQYDELQKSDNKSETVRKALEMHFKNQQDLVKLLKEQKEQDDTIDDALELIFEQEGLV